MDSKLNKEQKEFLKALSNKHQNSVILTCELDSVYFAKGSPRLDRNGSPQIVNGVPLMWDDKFNVKVNFGGSSVVLQVDEPVYNQLETFPYGTPLLIDSKIQFLTRDGFTNLKISNKDLKLTLNI